MNNDVDMIKIWVFYLKSHPNQVYAYTTVKKYKDQFLKIRDKNAFQIEKLTLDEFEFSMFTNEHRNQMLGECPLGYGTGYHEYVTLIMTQEEEARLDNFASDITHQMEDIYRGLILHSDLKDKYREAVEYLLDTSYVITLPHGGVQNTSRFNMLFGFSMLFKETLRKDYQK